ncbi:hypothetical protein GQ457_09G025760 [Hibiscus cannabinus]
MLEENNSKLMRIIQKKLDKLKIESFKCIPDLKHVKDYVDDCYKSATFLNTYAYTINLILGEVQWDPV